MEINAITIFGLVASVLVGILLGLLGGGGSILTVPLLVYLFGMSATMGTGASLLVVGLSAAVAAVSAWKVGEFEWSATWPFVLGSVPSVFAVRQWVIPAIPIDLLQIGEWNLTRDRLLLLLFGALMLLIGSRMLKKSGSSAHEESSRKAGLLLLIGIGTGFLAGMVGAGGGFIIVPALIFGAGLPMKRAVGTSLGIIAIQSMAGFVGAISTFQPSILGLISIVCVLAIAGVFMGRWLSGRMKADQIKPIFAWFVILMGLFVISKEIFF